MSMDNLIFYAICIALYSKHKYYYHNIYNFVLSPSIFSVNIIKMTTVIGFTSL